MKPITQEDWLKNPQPRNMWVWNDDETKIMKRKVLFIFNLPEGREWKVLALSPDEACTNIFKHCAEIKTQRRMTYQELSWWLAEKPRREYKYRDKSFVYNKFYYSESQQDESVPVKILIRENGGAWKEPLIEVEL